MNCTRIQKKPEAWQRLGVAADPDPIRKGEDRRSVVSYDAVSESGHRFPDLAEPEPAVAITFNWVTFAGQLGLSKVERAVFFGHFHREIPLYRLDIELGLTPQQIRVALASLREKLAGPVAKALAEVACSITEVHRETLPSGRRCWTPAAVDEEFREIIHAEKYSLYRQQDPSDIKENAAFLSVNIRSIMTAISELQQRRRDEADKLSRLNQRADASSLALAQIERSLEDIESDQRAEQEQAALEEKPWPSAGAEKAIREAQGKVATARGDLSAKRAAAARQAALLAGIEGELEQRRLEAFRAVLAPARAELFETLNAFVKAASRVNWLAYQHGIDSHVLGRELLLPEHSNDALGGFVKHSMVASLINSAISLQSYMASYYGRPYAE